MYYSSNTANKNKEQQSVDVLDYEISSHQLIVWNDDVNTFEWVIQTLIEICDQTEEQAEQCAFLIHFKGKYAVKNGNYNTLKPMCNSITDRGISATIEEIN